MKAFFEKMCVQNAQRVGEARLGFYCNLVLCLALGKSFSFKHRVFLHKLFELDFEILILFCL